VFQGLGGGLVVSLMGRGLASLLSAALSPLVEDNPRIVGRLHPHQCVCMWLLHLLRGGSLWRWLMLVVVLG